MEIHDKRGSNHISPLRQNMEMIRLVEGNNHCWGDDLPFKCYDDAHTFRLVFLNINGIPESGQDQKKITYFLTILMNMILIF